MKLTVSKDGKLRATVRVEHRLTAKDMAHILAWRAASYEEDLANTKYDAERKIRESCWLYGCTDMMDADYGDELYEEALRRVERWYG